MHSLLENLDALFITNPTNIFYLTGFKGMSPEEREAYVLITKNKTFLFTNALYVEQARKLKTTSHPERSEGFRPKAEYNIASLDSSPPKADQNDKIEIVEISREEQITQKMGAILESLFPERSRRNTAIKLGFEEDNLTFKEYQTLKTKLSTPSTDSDSTYFIDLIPTQNRVEELRKIKRPDEIEHIQNAARITDACFYYILKKLKPGVSESNIAWEIETFFRKNNAESAFSPIVAFNQNSSQPHYAPQQDYTLQGATLILLDFGARVKGYCADMTRVVFLGQPTEEQQKVYSALLEAQTTAIELLKSGERSGAKLDEATRNVLIKHNLPVYPHSLGHAVGLDIHEAPRLSFKKDEMLKPGMVITIEPGVYLEGNFGMRIEDLVLIKENGIEVLSESPKELVIV